MLKSFFGLGDLKKKKKKNLFLKKKKKSTGNVKSSKKAWKWRFPWPPLWYFFWSHISKIASDTILDTYPNISYLFGWDNVVHTTGTGKKFWPRKSNFWKIAHKFFFLCLLCAHTFQNDTFLETSSRCLSNVFKRFLIYCFRKNIRWGGG